LRRTLRKWLFVIYIVIGVVVAAGHHYFEHLNAVKPIVSAVLAVLLWPLVLFGISLHLK
jgi:Mn2+/Fe2+ NRAMP family transporter